MAMMAASCGSGAGCGGDADSSAAAVVAGIERYGSQDSMRMYVDMARDHVRKLVSEGRVAEARVYLDEVMPAVDRHAPKFSGEMARVRAAVDKTYE